MTYRSNEDALRARVEKLEAEAAEAEIIFADLNNRNRRGRDVVGPFAMGLGIGAALGCVGTLATQLYSEASLSDGLYAAPALGALVGLLVPAYRASVRHREREAREEYDRLRIEVAALTAESARAAVGDREPRR